MRVLRWIPCKTIFSLKISRFAWLCRIFQTESHKPSQIALRGNFYFSFFLSIIVHCQLRRRAHFPGPQASRKRKVHFLRKLYIERERLKNINSMVHHFGYKTNTTHFDGSNASFILSRPSFSNCGSRSCSTLRLSSLVTLRSGNLWNVGRGRFRREWTISNSVLLMLCRWPTRLHIIQ